MSVITAELEPVHLKCRHGQDDGSSTYMAFRIVGLPDAHGHSLMMRAPEAQYPGNATMQRFFEKSLPHIPAWQHPIRYGEVRQALAELVMAIEFTPLGVRQITALEHARKVLKL